MPQWKIDAQMGEAITVDLTPYCTEPGNYRIEMHLNSSRLPEAYVSNNSSPLVRTFAIAGSEPVNPEDPGTGYDSQDKVSTPATGDAALTAATALLVAAMLALTVLVVVRTEMRRGEVFNVE